MYSKLRPHNGVRWMFKLGPSMMSLPRCFASWPMTVPNAFARFVLNVAARPSVAGMAVVTGILTATKIFDAVSDPIMGSIVDKTRTRWGKMRPFILFSAFPVALLTTLLFAMAILACNMRTWERPRLFYFQFLLAESAVLGAFLGSVLVSELTNGLLQYRIGEFWVQTWLGLLLLLAVLMDLGRRSLLARMGSLAR